MTCKEIYNLHAFRAKESDLHDAYWDVPLDSRDETHKNNTSLHTACYFADITAVGILLDRGMDVNVKNDDGDTPLCVLARCNPCLNDAVFADIAGLLLSKGGKSATVRQGYNRLDRSGTQPPLPDG